MKNQNSKFFVVSVYQNNKTDRENLIHHASTMTDLYRDLRLAATVIEVNEGVETKSILIVDEPGVEELVVKLTELNNKNSFIEVSAHEREVKLNRLSGESSCLGVLMHVDKSKPEPTSSLTFELGGEKWAVIKTV